ncbi:MAG: helix-turn-helix transcriptional regulator, partial [Bacteroidales bacterium]|nr:helix-turn-helix transcriptional regulator [Bacteroidales bacterium]
MNTVGAKIKGLRELKKISLEEVSARSGLEVNQIQQIEDGNSIPSLSPMIKIARALGVRLVTFVDDSKELVPVVHRLADQADKGASFSCQNS